MTNAKPFLKWAGGKTQLLPQLRKHYPAELAAGLIRTYAEPFLGGGAVFFDVAQRYQISSFYLSDINPELVLVYRVVQEAPHEVLSRIDGIARQYLSLDEERRQDFYYQVRERYNRQLASIDYYHYSDDWTERAAYMLFLNKTCYNGLFRVNSKGEFNVPYGRYVRPSFVDEENLLNVSRLLDDAVIKYGMYTECESIVDDATFVYFDPPYRPVSATAHFTSYSRYRFDDEEQIKLAHFYAHLDKTYHCRLMLSNSDPRSHDPADDFFNELYGTYDIHRIMANRMINSNVGKRGKVSELLITNY